MHHLSDPRQRIFVALDMPQLDDAVALATQLRGRVGGFKVGLELCTAAGVPAVLTALTAVIAGTPTNLFLDLKLKDIPNTVAATVRVLAQHYGQYVHWLTLHCDGGSAMLQAAATALAAVAAAQPTQPPLLRLLGVTVLTSISPAMLADELAVAGRLTRMWCAWPGWRSRRASRGWLPRRTRSAHCGRRAGASWCW